MEYCLGEPGYPSLLKCSYALHSKLYAREHMLEHFFICSPAAKLSGVGSE